MTRAHCPTLQKIYVYSSMARYIMNIEYITVWCTLPILMSQTKEEDVQ